MLPRSNKELLIDQVNNSKSVTIENNFQGQCLVVDTNISRLTLSLFGGHVLSFVNKKDHKERLWLSKKAIFDSKTPIRGGIPICWPWFSSHYKEPNYPNHGFARTQFFTVVEIKETLSEQEVSHTQLTLIPTQLDLYGYNQLQMKLIIEISETLKVSVISTNNSEKNIALTQALHTYLRVDNIDTTVISGINTDYFDKVTNTLHNKAPIRYEIIGEVDRIHEHQHSGNADSQTIELFSMNSTKNEVLEKLVSLRQFGHDSTVVWNPGKDKSITMNDMNDEGFATMLCIEAANTNIAKTPLLLKPTQNHKLTQIIY